MTPGLRARLLLDEPEFAGEFVDTDGVIEAFGDGVVVVAAATDDGVLRAGVLEALHSEEDEGTG